ASLEKTLQLAPWYSIAAGLLGGAHARIGNRSRVKNLIRGFQHEHTAGYLSPVGLAFYHASLGEADRMFEYLEEALEHREPVLARLVGEPLFNSFRSDLRYRSLLRRMNLGSC